MENLGSPNNRKVEAKPKSKEVLQAQVAAFAAERVKDSQDRAHVLFNLDKIIGGELKDFTRVTDDIEYHTDDHGKPVRLPAGTERTTATAKEYVEFLRSVGGMNYKGIESRADMLRRYNEFAPIITRLKEELADLATRKKHPAYLGSGSNATVFSVERDGKKYAVRVPNGKAVNPASIDQHLAGAYLGKRVPHLEQIVAASYEDGVTVAEIMPGKETGDLSVEDVRSITDDQLNELVNTLMVVNERGIGIDPKPSNFFYDHEVGFGIVDYHSSKVERNSADQNLGKIVGWATTPISNAGFYGRPYRSEMTVEEYSADLEQLKANLEILKRYKTVVIGKLQGEVLETALKEINKTIQSSEETIQNYSDPEWVTKRIEQDREWKRQREEQLRNSPKDGFGSPVDTV